MEPIIEIRNVSKRYRLGEHGRTYDSFREALVQAARKPWGYLRRSGTTPHGSDSHGSFWALRDVSFDVNRGETVGILGSNGAGKSTLLKVISRVTDPTDGYIRLRGRMASLLEVGTGFHPELTGRENIYLNGSILGMRKVEIDAKFDEIVAFAGIDQFLDTPVKRYSSGMYVRLAFSIAAHIDPEMLIVDEVLAVGDVAFQRKCLGKMAEAYSRARTVLFVSHNLAAVENLCQKGVVLQQGRLVFSGTAKQAIDYYLRNISGRAAELAPHIIDLSHSAGRPNRCRRPMLKKLELYTEDGMPLTGELPVGAALRAKIYFTLEHPCVAFNASLAFDTATGQRACTAHSAYEPDRIHEERVGEQVFVCHIPSLALVPGEYKIHVGLDIGNEEVDLVEEATRLTVVQSDYYGTGIIPTKGTFLLKNRWKLHHPVYEMCHEA